VGRMDWAAARESQKRGAGPKAGTYLAYVREAVDSRSQKGDECIVVTLHEVRTEAELCRDWIMLQGGGCGIGAAKLSALGITEEHGEEVGAEDVLGRKVYVRLVLVKSTKLKNDGTPFLNLAPDMDAGEGWRCGYRGEDDPPEEADPENRHRPLDRSTEPVRDAAGAPRDKQSIEPEGDLPF